MSFQLISNYIHRFNKSLRSSSIATGIATGILQEHSVLSTGTRVNKPLTMDMTATSS